MNQVTGNQKNLNFSIKEDTDAVLISEYHYKSN